MRQNMLRPLETTTDDVLISALSERTKAVLRVSLDQGMSVKRLLGYCKRACGDSHLVYLACEAYVERHLLRMTKECN